MAIAQAVSQGSLRSCRILCCPFLKNCSLRQNLLYSGSWIYLALDLKILVVAVWKCLIFNAIIFITLSKHVLCEIRRELAEKELRVYSCDSVNNKLISLIKFSFNLRIFNYVCFSATTFVVKWSCVINEGTCYVFNVLHGLTCWILPGSCWIILSDVSGNMKSWVHRIARVNNALRRTSLVATDESMQHSTSMTSRTSAKRDVTKGTRSRCYRLYSDSRLTPDR